MKYKNNEAPVDMSNVSPMNFIMSQQFITDERDDFGVFVSQDLTFTKIWKLTNIDPTFLDMQDKHALADSFAHEIISKYPDGSTGQILRFTHRDIRPEIESYNKPHKDSPMGKVILDAVSKKQYRAARSPEGFFEDISNEMMDEAQKEQKKDEFSAFYSDDEDDNESAYSQLSAQARHGIQPLKSETWLTLSWKPTLTKRDSLIKFKDRLQAVIFPSGESKDVAKNRARNELFDNFKIQCLGVQESLFNTGFSNEAIEGQGFVECIYRILNPISAYSTPYPKYRRGMTVQQYLESPELLHDTSKIAKNAALSVIESRPDGFNIYPESDVEGSNDTYYYRASSVLAFNEQRFFADYLSQLAFNHSSGSIDGEGIMAINFTPLSNISITAKMAIKRLQIDLASKFKGKKKFENHEHGLMYVDEATNKENINAQKAFDTSIYYVAGSFSVGKAIERAATFSNRISKSSFTEKYAGNKIILQSLPGNYIASNKSMIDRSMPFMSTGLAHLAPLYGSYLGASDPMILFNNRQGRPVFVSLFGSHVGGVGHSLIVGGTGSGKTFTFAYILTTMIAKVNPKVWIIDKGESYKAICDIFNGSYMKMSLDENSGSGSAPMGFNLFRVIRDKTGKAVMPSGEDIEFVVNAVSELFEARSSESKLSVNDIQLIEDAAIEYFKKKDISEDGRFSELANTLRTKSVEGSSGERIAHGLKTYYEGTNKSLFESPKGVDWDGDLIVVETGNGSSKSAPILLGLMMQSISDYIVSKLEDDRFKIVAIDEAWALMNNSKTVGIIAMFFRTMRKHSCAVFLISQTVSDFVNVVILDDSSKGDGIVDNTAHYFLLQVAEKSFTAASEHLGFSPNDIQVWRSARAIRPFYSELFYRYQFDGTAVSSIIRLSSTPVQYWISTTHGKERTLRTKFINKHMKAANDDLLTATSLAVEELSKKYPWGLNYA